MCEMSNLTNTNNKKRKKFLRSISIKTHSSILLGAMVVESALEVEVVRNAAKSAALCINILFFVME